MKKGKNKAKNKVKSKKNKKNDESSYIYLTILTLMVFLFLGSLYYDDFKVKKEEKNSKNIVARIQEKRRNEARNKLLEQADYLFRGYYYDEAISLLNSNENLINEQTTELIEKINYEKNNLVLYEDTIQHIFFHSLVLYPEHLFPDLNKHGGLYASGFAYQRELHRILPQLLERGYVLYNINDVFGKDEDGIMKQKEVYLPPGKKPLILSVDDPSYHYGVGFANKMIVDKNGELATEVVTPEGKTIITNDGDVELVVNNFVKEHPEFSFRGAKGIVATTGYLGFMGHKLKTEESRQQAKAVADKLKETGWLMASHSFGHNHAGFWGPGSKPENIAYDTWEWRTIIEPIVGRTNLFLAPFGIVLPEESMAVLLRNGYDIYCSVNLKQETYVYNKYALMSRTEIGGYVFEFIKETIDELFFDVESVKDKHRPVLKGYL
jgi:hypothetical protein